MSEDQFTKLFKYIENFRKEVIEKFDKNQKDHLDIRRVIMELGGQTKV